MIIFKDICTALTNLEILNNDKHSERVLSEVLIVRERTTKKKKKHGGNDSLSKSRSRSMARDKCAFCHDMGHWCRLLYTKYGLIDLDFPHVLPTHNGWHMWKSIGKVWSNTLKGLWQNIRIGRMVQFW